MSASPPTPVKAPVKTPKSKVKPMKTGVDKPVQKQTEVSKIKSETGKRLLTIASKQRQLLQALKQVEKLCHAAITRDDGDESLKFQEECGFISSQMSHLENGCRQLGLLVYVDKKKYDGAVAAYDALLAQIKDNMVILQK